MTMKNKTYRFAAVAAVLLTLCLVFMAPVSAYEGAGTDDSPYLIQSPEDLEQVAQNVNAGTDTEKYFKLMASIDLQNVEWTPIGTTTNPFKGVFDGNDQTISNLTIPNGGQNVGFFGTIADGAVIKNLTLFNVDVSGQTAVGALVGGPRHSGAGLQDGGNSISNCKVIGTVRVTGNTQVGGLIGRADLDTISNCQVGTLENPATVIGDHLTEDSEGDNVGGLIGQASTGWLDVSVSDSVAYATVSGARKVGGLIGAFMSGSVNNCNAYAAVTLSHVDGYNDAGLSVGALIGNIHTGTMVHNHYSHVLNAGVTNSNAYGTVTIQDTDSAPYHAGFIGAVRNGGTYNAENDLTTIASTVVNSGWIAGDISAIFPTYYETLSIGTLDITAGTYSQDVTEYVADGYKCVYLEGEQYQVVKKTYTIEADKEEIAFEPVNVGYETIPEVVVEVTNTGSETITLDVDSEGASYYTYGTDGETDWELTPGESVDIIFMLDLGLVPGSYGESVTITPVDVNANAITDNAITLQLTATVNAVEGLYTIVYHENNGGASSSHTVTVQPAEDGSFSLTPVNHWPIVKNEYFFVGWNATSASGEYFDYGDGEYFNAPSKLFGEGNNVIELFAIWAKAAIEGLEINAVVNDGITNARFADDDEEAPSYVDITSTEAYLTEDSYPDNSTTITLSNGAQLTLVFTNEDDNDNFNTGDLRTVDAPIQGALVTYPQGNSSLRGELAGSTSHFVMFSMSNLIDIPTINGDFYDDKANAIKEHLGVDDAGILAMVSAEVTQGDNDNITGVYVEFDFYPHGRLANPAGFTAYHVNSGWAVNQLTRVQTEAELFSSEVEAFLVEEIGDIDNGGYWHIRLVGDGFSSYAVGYVAPSSDNTGGAGDDNEDDENQTGGNTGNNNQDTGNNTPNYNGGGGGKKPTTVTPTVPPTEEPTDDPTDVPGEQVPETPVTPETPEEPSTPAPILAVLAGLGAAVVLRRK